MKILRILILSLIISFFISALSIYLIFKYVLTPERIKNYTKSYVERSINEQFEKQKTGVLDKLSLSKLIGEYNIGKPSQMSDFDKEIEDIKVLESLNGKALNSKIADSGIVDQLGDVNMLASKITNMEVFNGLSDVNMLASKMFNSANMKMESLKYKITEYFSNKNTKEE